MKMMKRCTLLFSLGIIIVCFGIGVISTSLGTLAITSSYIRVFPFGAPLWIGTLVSGCADKQPGNCCVYTHPQNHHCTTRMSLAYVSDDVSP